MLGLVLPTFVTLLIEGILKLVNQQVTIINPGALISSLQKLQIAFNATIGLNSSLAGLGTWFSCELIAVLETDSKLKSSFSPDTSVSKRFKCNYQDNPLSRCKN